MCNDYHIGTLAEYTTEHDAIKVRRGIPAGGRIGNVNGVPAPDKPRTTHYSKPIAHPTNADSYIWKFDDFCKGDSQTHTVAEVKAAGWFPESGL